MKNTPKNPHGKSERGQAIILIAFAIVGMVAIVGLMTDGGILLIEYARLKRGIDSASIAAAAQFRKPLSGQAGIDMGVAMEKAGKEFLKFNQSDAAVTIWTCSYPGTSHDDTLCPAATGGVARKLVRITASRHVNFGFMRVVGMTGTDITATAIGEAASIDMVLAIDTSASMAFETTVGGNPNVADAAVPGDTTNHPGDDPEVCNAAANLTNPLKRCEPMGKVKDVAENFIDQLFYPYDRVAVVAFTQQTAVAPSEPPQDGRAPVLVTAFSEDQNTVRTAIRGLKALQLARCVDTTYAGTCLAFDANDGHFQGEPCMPKTAGNGDPTGCGSSNIGGGLKLAGEQFGNGARTDSFWVVIALIGGPANATDPDPTDPGSMGSCPNTAGAGQPTWSWPGSPVGFGLGFCRDRDPMPSGYDAATYHANYVTNPNSYNWSTYNIATQTRHNKTSAEYDADDYARDQADFITSPTTGQGATMFAICLGSYCRDYPSTDPASAEHLGQYMALRAGDSAGPPAVTANHGLYFWTESTSGLEGVFNAIAENIFTRISQ